jgi:hypothetical protein
MAEPCASTRRLGKLGGHVTCVSLQCSVKCVTAVIASTTILDLKTIPVVANHLGLQARGS